MGVLTRIGKKITTPPFLRGANRNISDFLLRDVLPVSNEGNHIRPVPSLGVEVNPPPPIQSGQIPSG